MSKVIKSFEAYQVKTDLKTITIRNLADELKNRRLSESIQEDGISEVLSESQVQKQLETALESAQVEADRIIESAKMEAEQIRQQIELDLSDAEIVKQKYYEEAKQQGYEDGYSNGQMEGLESYNSLIEQGKQIVKQSEEQFNQSVEDAEPVVLELSVELAKKILGTMLIKNDDNWHSLLKQVMNEFREHENVKLYVHPDWFDTTIKQKEELEQLLSHTEHLFIYPDSGLMRNGCIIESKHGRIDASLDSQLSELRTQLLEKLKEDSA